MMQLANALYFPYINIQNTGWLKTAALYYSKLLRIVPEPVRVQDDKAARILGDELGFIENIDAEYEAGEISQDFLLTMRENSPSPTTLPSFFYEPLRHGKQLGPVKIHLHKFSLATIDALMEMGLAEDWRRRRRLPQWIKVERRAAAIYMTMLAERIAERRGIVTVTDDPLFQRWLRYFGFDPQRVSQDSRAWRLPYVVIRSAVPRGVDRVPIAKILEFRRAHDAERLRFFAAVNSMSKDLVAIEDQKSLDDCLQQHQQSIGDAVNQLRRALRGVRIEAATGLLSLSLPPVVAQIVRSPSAALVAGGVAVAAGVRAVQYAGQYARARW